MHWAVTLAGEGAIEDSAPATRSRGLDSRFLLYYNHIVMKPNSYAMTPSARLDATFAALADPTRRAILARLASGEAAVMELARPFAMSQPAISKHLKVLERAGLIARGRDAQRRPCRIVGKPLAEADAWLERYRQIWEANFQRLDALLEELKTEEKNRGRRKR
jgi:DNA-binding transcriptional ArsR family regulator